MSKMIRRLFLPALVLLPLFTSVPAAAQIEPGYDPGKPRAVTLWYGRADADARKADLHFVAGMRPHHAGALSMSDEYLQDAESRNGPLRQLARGIIRNQEFEIKMLDEIERHNKANAHDLPRVLNMRPVATGNLSQGLRYSRAPMPGPLDYWAGPNDVSTRDVQFAKAMIVHHQGALDMARDYLRDPHAHNTYLRRMCLDILLDQAQEIAFMESVINAYQGDADAVKIDASMIHGMDAMGHHH